MFKIFETSSRRASLRKLSKQFSGSSWKMSALSANEQMRMDLRLVGENLDIVLAYIDAHNRKFFRDQYLLQELSSSTGFIRRAWNAVPIWVFQDQLAMDNTALLTQGIIAFSESEVSSITALDRVSSDDIGFLSARQLRVMEYSANKATKVAQEFVDKKNYDLGIKWFEIAISANSKHLPARIALFKAYLAIEDWEAAKRVGKEAGEVTSGHQGILREMAKLSSKLGKKEEEAYWLQKLEQFHHEEAAPIKSFEDLLKRMKTPREK